MKWQWNEISLLFNWAENKQLSAEQLQQAAAMAPLVPGEGDWRRFLSSLLLWGGALCLASGIVFFFAYNWVDMGRLQRLVFANLVLLASTLATTLLSHPFSQGWRVGCLVISIAIGALLALIGQTYQTGADMWQLFAAWTALMLPVAVLSRSSVCWALLLALANFAAWRWNMQNTGGFFSSPDILFSIQITAANACALALFEFGQSHLLQRPSRCLPLFILLLLLLPLSHNTVMSYFNDSAQAQLPLFLLAVSPLFYFYRYQRLNTLQLGLLCTASLCVLMAGFIRQVASLANWEDMVFILLFLALVLIVIVSVICSWLLRLRREQTTKKHHNTEAIKPKTEPASTDMLANKLLRLKVITSDTFACLQQFTALHAQKPVWLLSLQTLASLVAALLSMGSVVWCFLLFAEPFSSGLYGLSALVGAVFIVVSMFMMRASASNGFSQLLGLSLSLVGQICLFSAIYMYLINFSTHENFEYRLLVGLFYLCIFIVSVCMTLPTSTALHRTLCTVVVVGSLNALLAIFVPYVPTLPLLCALILGLWHTRPLWVSHPKAPLFKAFANASLLLAAYTLLYQIATIWWVSLWVNLWATHWFYGAACALVWLGSLWLVSTSQQRPMPWCYAGLALTPLALVMPNLLLTLSLIVLMFQSAQRLWLALWLALAVALFGCYYYDLNLTLLNKSFVLVALGGGTLLGRSILRLQQNPQRQPR